MRPLAFRESLRGQSHTRGRPAEPVYPAAEGSFSPNSKSFGPSNNVAIRFFGFGNRELSCRGAFKNKSLAATMIFI